jgi:pimeloyl-ACP methyl ester carboxylesterase
VPPETRYARSGDLSIAYQLVGDGPVDLVAVHGDVSHVEWAWEEPSVARYLRRLASFSRLLHFDKRGTGLSDGIAGISTLEERMDDIRAVMDAAGSERAVILGVAEGGPLAALFAATYPERASALILYGGMAPMVRWPDYPWRPPADEAQRQLAAAARTIHRTWGSPEGVAEVLRVMAPAVADDTSVRRWLAAYLHLAASPGAAINLEIDVRHVLSAIRVPTLVLYRAGDRAEHVAEGRYLARHIPGARYIELPGATTPPITATPRPSQGRSRSSSPVCARSPSPTASWPRCSSLTSCA